MFWERTPLKVGSRERENMATLKIRIEGGFFAETYGCMYVYDKTPTHLRANNWECRIKDDGTIVCDAKKEYKSGEYSMRYIIYPNGFAKLTLKAPGKKLETLKKGFVIPKGSKLTDGLIGLSSGPIYNRYAYFRDGSFQKFLDTFGITAVEHADPNGEYTIRHAWYGGGECSSYLLTDGEVESLEVDTGRSQKWSEGPGYTCAHERDERTAVSGASWAIHQQTQHEGDKHNCFKILYTLEKNPQNLSDSIREAIKKK